MSFQVASFGIQKFPEDIFIGSSTFYPIASSFYLRVDINKLQILTILLLSYKMPVVKDPEVRKAEVR
jgi:hypothetical protein